MRFSLHMPLKQFVTSLLAVLAIGACGQLLPIGKTPEPSYTLRYIAGDNPPEARGAVIFLDDPLMAQGLGGRVITVDLADGERRALKGARWAEPLSSLLRNYFERSLQDQTDANIVAEGGLDIDAACRVGLKVWSFEVKPGSSRADDRVRASIEATLVSLRSGALLGRQLLNSEQVIAGSHPRDVVAAFDQALQPLSEDLSLWLSDLLADCAEA